MNERLAEMVSLAKMEADNIKKYATPKEIDNLNAETADPLAFDGCVCMDK